MGIELTVGQKAPHSRCHATVAQHFAGAIQGSQACHLFLPQGRHPGCTRESIDFSKLRAEFDKAGTDIWGLGRSGKGAGRVQEKT